jgi:hypothetical protein
VRCEQCCKFVSYDEPQMDVQDESIDEDGNILVSVHMVLPCMECGTELKETIFELETQIEHECKHAKKEASGVKKPVPSRYQTHYYSVWVSGRATCSKCKEQIDFTMTDEISAGGMEEIC